MEFSKAGMWKVRFFKDNLIKKIKTPFVIITIMIILSLFSNSTLVSVAKQQEHEYILGENIFIRVIKMQQKYLILSFLGSQGFTDTSFIGGTDINSEGDFL